MKWKAADYAKQNEYDCQICLLNNWIEKKHRICFRYNKENDVAFPLFQFEDAQGNSLPVVRQLIENGQKKYEWVESATVDDVYDWLKEMDRMLPQMNSFSLLQTYLGNVCIEGIFDLSAAQIYGMEQAVEKYGLEILNVPKYIYDGFEAIRAAENRYENLQNYETRKKIEAQQGKK